MHRGIESDRRGIGAIVEHWKKMDLLCGLELISVHVSLLSQENSKHPSPVLTEEDLPGQGRGQYDAWPGEGALVCRAPREAHGRVWKREGSRGRNSQVVQGNQSLGPRERWSGDAPAVGDQLTKLPRIRRIPGVQEH